MPTGLSTPNPAATPVDISFITFNVADHLVAKNSSLPCPPPVLSTYFLSSSIACFAACTHQGSTLFSAAVVSSICAITSK